MEPSHIGEHEQPHEALPTGEDFSHATIGRSPELVGSIRQDITVASLTVDGHEVLNFDTSTPKTIVSAEEILSEYVQSEVVYAGRNRFVTMPPEEALAYRVERLQDAAAARLDPPVTPRLSADSVVFAAPSTSGLGERILRELGAQRGQSVIDKFPNSETRIEIHDPVRGRHAFVIADMAAPVNESVMETALMVQALTLAGAARVTVVTPYFGYSRQDRKSDTRPPISSRAVTDILAEMGADQIIAVDLHARQIEGFFKGPFDNLEGLPHIAPSIVLEEGADLIVVSPDAGGSKRAQRFAGVIEHVTGAFTPLLVMSKFRSGVNTPPTVMLTGAQDFSGKTCILVDDMIDTGGSILAAARELKSRGAQRVIVAATHGIFSRGAIDRLEADLVETPAGHLPTIDRIFTTDTVALNRARSDFIKVISLAPLLAESIARLDQRTGTLSELNERRDLGDPLPSYR